MISILQLPASKLREIIKETKKDDMMKDDMIKELVRVINEDWYNNMRLHTSRPLWNFKEELTLIEGVFFIGENIFILPTLRVRVWNKVHHNHIVLTVGNGLVSNYE